MANLVVAMQDLHYTGLEFMQKSTVNDMCRLLDNLDSQVDIWKARSGSVTMESLEEARIFCRYIVASLLASGDAKVLNLALAFKNHLGSGCISVESLVQAFRSPTGSDDASKDITRGLRRLIRFRMLAILDDMMNLPIPTGDRLSSMGITDAGSWRSFAAKRLAEFDAADPEKM
jgi:hypothetical protein